jgi:hypothetical protein
MANDTCVGLMAVVAVSSSVAFLAHQLHQRLASDYMKKIEMIYGNKPSLHLTSRVLKGWQFPILDRANYKFIIDCFISIFSFLELGTVKRTRIIAICVWIKKKKQSKNGSLVVLEHSHDRKKDVFPSNFGVWFLQNCD